MMRFIRRIVLHPEVAIRVCQKVDRVVSDHKKFKAILVFGGTMALVAIIQGDMHMLAEVVALQGTAMAALIAAA